MSRIVASWRASHVPGRWPVLMGPSSLVILDPTTSTDVTALWQQVVVSASMAELVTALAGVGPDQSPDLLALFWSSAGMRSLVRGNIRLLDPATAEVVADGAGMLTWREQALDDHEQIEIDLGSGPVGGRGLPLVVGAVQAGAIRIEAGEGAAVISPQALGVDPTTAADDFADWSTDVGDDAMPRDEPLGSADVDPIAADALWPPVQRPPVVVPALSPTPAGPTVGPTAGPPNRAGSGAAAGAERTDSPLPGGLTRRTTPPTMEEVIEVEAADGHAQVEEVPPADAPERPGAPLVQAAICLSGHPNPPNAHSCAMCGAPVPPQTTQLVPRPVLGILRSPDGASTPIDRPVLVGRAPVTRDDLSEVPELMRVPSPGQDISRTHLLVRPDGWDIVLVDLHSTNGTAILRPGPGTDRVQLQAGEPLGVTAGTVIELGDGVAVLVDGPPPPRA